MTSTTDVLQQPIHHTALDTLTRCILYNTTPIATNHTVYTYYENTATAADFCTTQLHPHFWYYTSATVPNRLPLQHTAPRCYNRFQQGVNIMIS